MLCGASPHFCVVLTACRKSLAICPTSSHLRARSHINKFLAKYGLQASFKIALILRECEDWHMIPLVCVPMSSGGPPCLIVSANHEALQRHHPHRAAPPISVTRR